MSEGRAGAYPNDEGRGMANPNPYQPYFHEADRVIAALRASGELTSSDREAAADTLARAAFVLGNLINAQSQVYPMLFIPADAPETGNSDTEGTPPTPHPEEG